MGLLNKLKNVFFEEEYVEVEEVVKPKKPVAVAKKIELPENKKVEVEEVKKEEPHQQEIVTPVIEEQPRKESFRFPMDFDDADFKEEKKASELKVVEVAPMQVEVKEEMMRPIMQDPEYTGLYEGNPRKQRPIGFKASPIISPIYGVLDKNYKKEEIITKKEIRLSSASYKKLDFDSVREKAYGDLSADITSSILDTNEEKATSVAVEEEVNLLYDLNEEDKPTVSKVTVGDAEEYFSDLGLEYNVDYKDHTREVATGRRIKAKEEKEEDNAENEELENNLFDLIDSMYEDKE